MKSRCKYENISSRYVSKFTTSDTCTSDFSVKKCWEVSSMQNNSCLGPCCGHLHNHDKTYFSRNKKSPFWFHPSPIQVIHQPRYVFCPIKPFLEPILRYIWRYTPQTSTFYHTYPESWMIPPLELLLTYTWKSKNNLWVSVVTRLMTPKVLYLTNKGVSKRYCLSPREQSYHFLTLRSRQTPSLKGNYFTHESFPSTVWLKWTARFSVHILLIYHYEINLDHLSDLYSLVIGLYKS